MADVHANLPALRATLDRVKIEGCDLVVHLGDSIAIGPYPAECLDLLLNTPRTTLIMGNHDAWYARGLPEPRPSWMTEGEVEHQQWTHDRIGPDLRRVVAQWPYASEQVLEGVKMTFLHYGLTESGKDHALVIRNPAAPDLDALFKGYGSGLIFYGHTHGLEDLQGRARYVSPGSLGCWGRAVARFTVLTVEDGKFLVERHGAPYDGDELYTQFEKCDVPAREFIYRVFFEGMYPR